MTPWGLCTPANDRRTRWSVPESGVGSLVSTLFSSFSRKQRALSSALTPPNPGCTERVSVKQYLYAFHTHWFLYPSPTHQVRGVGSVHTRLYSRPSHLSSRQYLIYSSNHGDQGSVRTSFRDMAYHHNHLGQRLVRFTHLTKGSRANGSHHSSMAWFGYDQGVFSGVLISADFKKHFPETEDANISGITSSCFSVCFISTSPAMAVADTHSSAPFLEPSRLSPWAIN